MWTSVTDCCIKIVHQITRRKSVLYVCERVNSNLGGSMATPRDTSGRHTMMSEQQQQQQRPQQHQHQDPALSYPYQVALPDGEVQHHDYEQSLRLSGAHEQEAELTRGYIKPPENRCLCELEPIKPHLSCSMGFLASREACNIIRSYGPSSSHYPQQQQRSYSTNTALHPIHRHSSPLETPHHCHRNTNISSFSSSSSSSSLSSWSVSGAAGDDNRSSALVGRKHSSQRPFLNLSHSRQKNLQDRSKRQTRGTALTPEQRPIVSGSSSSSSSTSSTSSSCSSMQPHSPLLACPSAPTALSDIAILPCGTAHSTPHFPSRPEDQVSLFPWDQQRLQFGTQRLSPRDYSSPLSDEEPPLYSDVISNPYYKDISRPREPRTDSDKM